MMISHKSISKIIKYLEIGFEIERKGLENKTEHSENET
jgi:hypothetical protein